MEMLRIPIHGRSNRFKLCFPDWSHYVLENGNIDASFRNFKLETPDRCKGILLFTFRAVDKVHLATPNFGQTVWLE